ncbi:MAG: SpoIID/LytB domain-containing protein [Candidatus Omnitrophota bacterium]
MVSPLTHRSKLRITVVLLAAGCLFYGTGHGQAPRYVRVLIMENVSSLRLKINGPFDIFDSASNKVLSRGKNLNTTVTTYKEGILLGSIRARTNKLFIRPYYPESVIINGRAFRGDIQFIKDKSKLSAINHIELEDYIKGISIREISHYWPVDSLKAEVIAFRTFAVYKMQENAQKSFDLTSDIYSQSYGGRSAERYRINKAVDETRGMVLTYKGKIIPAFYHATCAGRTEDASVLWNINTPPLKGVDCGFCRESPHFEWHSVLSLKEIRDALVRGGLKIDEIKGITILGKNKSNRITELKITTDKKDFKVSGKDFRNILGSNVIKSINFQVKVVDHDAVFEGFGWGHGVGLCQWGGYFMAKQGYDYKQILEYYYPGAVISALGGA